MIFVDASALTAAIGRESLADRIIECLDTGAGFFTSPVAVYETALAVARIADYSVQEALAEVEAFLDEALIRVEHLDSSHANAALAAFAQFGKGRHPAKLNMGDCFAYAATKARGASILFVGDDFSQTDLRSALSSS
jgi:ribonuclease VapC